MFKQMFKQVPNALTILRFIFIPFIILSLKNDDYLSTFILLTISGLTDVLDGWIARKFNFITNFGKLMDPLADKLTQLTVLTTLALKRYYSNLDDYCLSSKRMRYDCWSIFPIWKRACCIKQMVWENCYSAILHRYGMLFND